MKLRYLPDRWRRTLRCCLATPPRPTWNAAHEDLPFVFVSSACLASAGLAMVTTPVREAGPARNLAVLGVVGDVLAMKVMERRMDPVAAEPLHQGKAGTMLKWSERLAVAGGLGTLLGGRNRVVAAASGRGVAGCFGADPVRRVRGGTCLRQGPAVHHRTAKEPARGPPRGRRDRRRDHHRQLTDPSGVSGSRCPGTAVVWPITGWPGQLADHQQAAGGLGIGQKQQVVLGDARRGRQMRTHPVEVAPCPAGDKAVAERLAALRRPRGTAFRSITAPTSDARDHLVKMAEQAKTRDVSRCPDPGGHRGFGRRRD